MKDRKMGKTVIYLFFWLLQKIEKKIATEKQSGAQVGFHIWPVTQALNFAPD